MAKRSPARFITPAGFSFLGDIMVDTAVLIAVDCLLSMFNLSQRQLFVNVLKSFRAYDIFLSMPHL